MKKLLYPDWYDIKCAECGEIVKVFCFTKKDRVSHLHFCDGDDCLTTYYNKRFGGKKARYTIARLLSMRHNRNQRVSEYLRQQGEVDNEVMFYSKPNEEAMKRIRKRDDEYKIKLRLHKGVGV